MASRVLIVIAERSELLSFVKDGVRLTEAAGTSVQFEPTVFPDSPDVGDEVLNRQIRASRQNRFRLANSTGTDAEKLIPIILMAPLAV